MEIKASCKFDYNAVKALTYISMFKKSVPKKRMIFSGILFSALLAVLIFEIVLFGADLPLIICVVAAGAALLLDLFMWFVYPKICYNALAKMKGAQNEYTFTEDKIFITTQSSDYNAQAEVEYTLLAKVYETSEYMFLYQTKNQVFPVDKSTVTGGTVEEIRGKIFSYLEKKYVICKY